MPSGNVTIFDALIVGAGPAGSMLGHLLAKRGLQVAIIDKQRFPREKVCGGGLSRKSVELIDADIAPIVHKTIRGAFLTYQNTSTLIKDVDPPVGYTVVRSEFDQFLLDRACTSGAQFFAETTFVDACQDEHGVEVRSDRGTFQTRLLFAADGVASVVRNKVFGRNIVRYVPSLEAIVVVDDEHLSRFGDRAVFDFGGMSGGYGWIFPKRDHLNVGIYSPSNGRALRSQLDRFIARYSGLKRIASIRYQGYAIPVRNTAGAFQKGRTWLLGDAAGLAESVFGEGIYFALKSAVLAAQAVDENEFSPSPLRYSQLLRQHILPELRASEWLAKMLYLFPHFAFSHLVTNNDINRHFAGLISGDTGYRQCVARTAQGIHKWLRRTPPPDQVVRL